MLPTCDFRLSAWQGPSDILRRTVGWLVVGAFVHCVSNAVQVNWQYSVRNAVQVNGPVLEMSYDNIEHIDDAE